MFKVLADSEVAECFLHLVVFFLFACVLGLNVLNTTSIDFSYNSMLMVTSD